MSNEVRSPKAPRTTRRGVALPAVDPAAADRGFSLPPDLLASLLADGDQALVAWMLRNAMAERGRAAAYDELLRNAMALIGERWVSGQWGIAEEHLASQTLVQALDEVRPDPVTDPAAPLAVLAGVSGEQHSIGLVCLAHVLEEAGWSVANLGADVPGADIGRFASRQGARLVAITASLEDRLPTVRETVGTVRAAIARSRTILVLGGRVASVPGRAEQLGVDWAGSSLAALADALPELRRRA